MRTHTLITAAATVAAGAAFAMFVDPVLAAPVSGASATAHTHATGSLESPFFTQATDESGDPTYDFGATNGLAGTTVSNTSTSASTVGTITIAGDATPEMDFTDGNGLPAGVVLTYDIAWTWTSVTADNLVTAGGNTGNGLGASDGDAYGNFFAEPDDDPSTVGQGVDISAATVSNVTFDTSGLDASMFSFTDGTVDDVGFSAFRSNNFAGGNRAQLTGVDFDGNAITVLFDEQTPEVRMDNNFNNAFGPVSLLDPSQFVVSNGGTNLKGFALTSAYSYDLEVIPEPASLSMLGLAALGLCRRRRAC